MKGNFFERTRDAKKVMVLDLGFLGDTVHLLPALWTIRQSYPRAELHAAVAAHIAPFMDCVPWVNKIWGYMRYPRHATMRENFEMISNLRREKFDVLINLNGSDRSSWLTFFSGAHERLGRVPENGGPPFWKQMFTAHVECPHHGEPVYLQKCRALALAGFPQMPPEFHVEISAANLPKDFSASEKYFHISPFTTADYKELPPEQLVELLGALEKKIPKTKIVLSCAPTEREKNKMAALLDLLPQKPWRVFSGDLNLAQIAAVIKYGALHFCGDTGTLHLAAATRTPTVAWFWPNPALPEWQPRGEMFRVIVVKINPEKKFLDTIATNDLLREAETALAARK
jgi:heptosyltransferase-3